MLGLRITPAVVLGIVLSCAAPLSAQPSCTTTVQVIPYTLSGVRFQVVSIPAVTARVNGRQARISLPRLEHRPLRIVLLLDASGSMQPSTGIPGIHPSPNRWQLALSLAQKLVKFAPAGSAFGVLAFSGKDRRAVPMTDNVALLTTKLNELRDYRGDPHESNHRTPLWDSLEEAERTLGSSSDDGVIIVVTDGGENNSRTGESKLIGDLRTSGVRLFSIVLSAEFQGDQEREGKGDLSLLAREHGGFSQEVDATKLAMQRPSEIDHALSTTAAMFLALLTNSYAIDLDNDSRAKPAKLSFESPDRKVLLLYPRKLVPCANP